MESLSLLELNEYIQRIYALNFPESIWVHFELSNVKESRGHLYFDCIEKDEITDEIVAHQGGAIWRRQLSFLKKKLGKISEEILHDGVVIAAKVNVEYHPRYGAKLNVLDIDPAYTYGQLALEREKTIERLKKEGLFDLNQRLYCPMVIQRVAVVSNVTAAGYQDFLNQVSENVYGYAFDITLFESALQGKQVEFELPYQLEKINELHQDFDVTVIIRGGGSKLDLSAFDHYKVAAAIGKMSIPVWTGIGHEIDESISDLVSNQSFKTPTAVAEALIAHNANFEGEIRHFYQSIQNIAQGRLHQSYINLNQKISDLQYLTENRLTSAKYQLETSCQQLQTLTHKIIDRARWELQSLSQQVSLMDPQNLLDKGFLIMESRGEKIKSIHQVEVGESVDIYLSDGHLNTEIKKKNPS